MKTVGLFSCLIASIFISTPVAAEVYMNFVPYQSLSNVKKNYPNASITDVKAAWLGANESFKSLTGTGINGKIFLKFSHIDEFNEQERSKYAKKIEAEPNSDHESDQRAVDSYTNRLALPLDDRLQLDWVRFVPQEPIPFVRLEARYGKPEKCDYDPNDFQPYCLWAAKGVSVGLDAKKSLINYITYSFTFEDISRHLGLPMTAPNPAPSQKQERSSGRKIGKKEM